MDNGKFSSELNLYINNASGENEKTLKNIIDLEGDYAELILKYNGELDFISEELSGTYTELLGGYAVAALPIENITKLSNYRQIEYIELPKPLYFEVNNGRAASCINPVTIPPYSLTGKGVLAAIIDSGIDYSHPDFINPDKTTRILRLYDQTTGIIYDSEDINKALALPPLQRQTVVNETDVSGHGTHVAGILAGNGNASFGQYTGVAPECSLIIVKLGSSVGNAFPKTTHLMIAIDYVIKTSIELNMPLVINISFGNTYGPHDGSSLLEGFINTAAGYSRVSIITGTGNEGAAFGHASGILTNPVSPNSHIYTELQIGSYEPYITVQMWKNYYDNFSITLTSPNGTKREIFPNQTGSFTYLFENVKVLLYNAAPTPLTRQQELFFVFVPTNSYLPSGIWRFDFNAVNITSGRYDLYLTSSAALNPGTIFLQPDPYVTLTNPSSAYYTVSVAAYNQDLDSYADFSGRGYTRENIFVKPDICAPGVNITSASPGGGYTSKSGTSMATPFVSGSAALLMEWGIVRGNDRYLYGEKLKAYLIKGARKLAGYTEWPNRMLGYGALCLRNSLPL